LDLNVKRIQTQLMQAKWRADESVDETAFSVDKGVGMMPFLRKNGRKIPDRQRAVKGSAIHPT
jgi:hypothetical protein